MSSDNRRSAEQKNLCRNMLALQNYKKSLNSASFSRKKSLHPPKK